MYVSHVVRVGSGRRHGLATMREVPVIAYKTTIFLLGKSVLWGLC